MSEEKKYWVIENPYGMIVSIGLTWNECLENARLKRMWFRYSREGWKRKEVTINEVKDEKEKHILD
jgi:hypothetical protein